MDEKGFIVQLPEDPNPGGDTLHREGFMAVIAREAYDQNKMTLAEYLLWRERYYKNISILKDRQCKGNYARHWNITKWYGQFDRMSRDQETPNLAAFGGMDLEDLKKDMIEGSFKRAFLFTTNTRGNSDSPKRKLPDFTLFGSWALMIRMYKESKLKDLLSVFDLSLYASSLLWIFKFQFMKNDTDILNHWVSLVRSKRCNDTYFAREARAMMFKRRDKVQACFDDYFKPSNFGAPFNILLRDILEDSLR